MSKVSLQEEGAERRRALRAELIVRVDYSTVDELFSEFTRDINDGGLFIETEKLKPAGTEVTMQFNLPGSGEVVQTVGRVVHISSGDEFAPSGMGIEFDDISEADRNKINGLIRALRIGSAQP
ncbi:MAG: PilZ domain-containing protein [Deltaproteobacteria bacterium]|nr:PilZ domain-containing protein [Deltaproteobacteria bacterium]